MLKLAKLLRHRGFHITFVNTEFNHMRFLKSLGPYSLDGLPDFRFETIPEGLPESDENATQEVTLLCESFRSFLLLAPFRELVKLNEWGSGMEIHNNVKRDEVEMLVRELMEGEKGKKLKKKAKERKKLAENATDPHGSSSINLDNIVHQVLLRKN
ncbi:hypothetical protein L3X38_024240 [Prunus dulcis]|uniref:Uncharacterized protein n=1 Tax=Prunus dulcis TaxID=3755 RepID=A0AAD4W1E6_PRUDU|nr:hypothetical protein L3X38_024240 [Prunus dulcis]